MKHTVEEVRLKNGARGLLIDVPDATVMCFEFHFRAGDRYTKNQDVYESAHIMEHMAFGANAKFKDEHEFEAEFTKNGAYHNAFTSDLSMVYTVDCADFEWERILNLQELSICHPRFNERELTAEKGNVKSELTGYLNNHDRLLWPRMQQLLGEDILTLQQRLKTISNITLQDIKKHHAHTHTSDNMRFVIAGRLKGRKRKIINNLEAWCLKRGERLVAPRDELHSAKPTLIRRKEASNITFAWSMILPRILNDKELAAMHHLNHLLTGTMHSYIFGTARKQGLAYSMFSGANASVYESSWDFGGQVNHETATQLFDIMQKQIKRILRGDIPKSDLEAAKSYMLGRYQMGGQTPGQICNFYTGRYFSDGTINDYEGMPKRIAGTTLECMVETARQFINAETWAFAMVGSGEHSTARELASGLSELYKSKNFEG